MSTPVTSVASEVTLIKIVSYNAGATTLSGNSSTNHFSITRAGN